MTTQTRKLRITVKNPTADRRKRKAFKHAAEWPEGTIVRIEDKYGGPTESGGYREMCWPGGYTQYAISEHDPRFAMLVDASDPIALDTFDAVHDAHGRDADYRAVVKALVMRGVVTLDVAAELIRGAASFDLYEEIGEGEEG